MFNDPCADAVPIFVGTTAFSTVGATTDGPPLPPCGGVIGVPLVDDIWYHFTAPATGVVTVSTCDTVDYDSVLAAYAGTTCVGTLVGCTDDSPECGNFSSVMTFATTAGATYLIRVGGYFRSGSGSIEIGY